MSAEEWTARLVRTWVAAGRPEEIEEIVAGINQGKITLLDVVKALGEYLTSEEDTLRTKGVEVLSELLAKCPPEQVNRQSAKVLATFYCSKLDDTETIIPALQGLKSLAQLPTFTSIDATEVMKAISQHVKMRALVQAVRHTVLSIVDILLARRRDALKAMAGQFLSSYIDLAENEKDPRNLLVAFAIARVILIEFDISKHVEGLHNIIFCYFPISYRPPPDDPYGISPDDLRTALRKCICATPLFGPMAVPVFLEKLMAGSPITKRDTLKTMAESLPVYGSNLAASRAQKLWSSLKLEIFQPSDPETEQDALTATQSLVNTIYADGDRDDNAIEGFAEEVCKECLEILREPEKSQARPAIKVICALISTTSSISKYVTSAIVPHLVGLFLDPDEISNREAVLALLSATLIAIRNVDAQFSTPDAMEEDKSPLLAPFKDEVLGVLTVGLKIASTRKPALDGLESFVLMKNLLADEEVGFVVHNINETMQADDIGRDMDTLLTLLSTISAIAPRHLEETTLPLLFSFLPDRAPPLDAASEREKYWKTLASLKKLCVQPVLFETLVIRLSTKLDLICSTTPSHVSPDDDTTETSTAYAHAILKTLADVLIIKIVERHTDIPKYAERLLPGLFHLFIHAALSAEKTVAADLRLIRSVVPVITLIVQSLPQKSQAQFAASLFSAFTAGAVKALASGHTPLPQDVHFGPLLTDATTKQKNTVPLLAAGVIALRAEATMLSPSIADFLTNMIRWTVQDAENDLQRDAGLHIIASVLNKHAPDLTEFLAEAPAVFWQDKVLDANLDVGRRRAAILAWVWISKALLVRNHATFGQLTDQLFELFDDEHMHVNAAKAIGMIGSGGDEVLTKDHHAVVKILHRQKFVSKVLPTLIEGAQVAEDSRRKESCLIALTSLVKSVPHGTYVHEMPKLVPLLLRGLDLPDPEMHANILETLLAAAATSADTSAQTKPNLLSEHASSLARALLRNVLVEEMPSTRVRIAALRYLAAIPSLVRYDILHPLKPEVVRALGKAVDDPKRAVRKEAVDARTEWLTFSG